jgi:O-antigen ligase
MTGESFMSLALCAIAAVLPLLAGGNELYLFSPHTALLVAQLAILALVVIWWIVRLEHWRWAVVPQRIILWSAGFIVVSMAATVTSVTLYQSELKIIQLVTGLILAYAATDLFRTERDLHRAAWALLWGGALTAAYGIEQGIFGLPDWLVQAQTNRASQNLVEMVSQGRIFSTFINVNAFAAFLVMVLPIGGYLLLREVRPGAQLLAGGLVLLMVGALAMTGSKGGWLVALVVIAGLISVIVGSVDRWRLVKRLGVIVLTAFLLVGFIWTRQPSEIENPMERLFAVTMGLKESAEGRWSYWQGGRQIIEQHPVLGTGPGTFGISYQQVQSDGHYARYAHNLYLQMAGEIGMIGLVVFLVLIGMIGLLGWKLREHREFGRILLLGGGALLLHGFIDFSWEVEANQWLFFLLCGMVLALWRLEQGDAGVTEAALSRSGRAVWTLAAIPVAVVCLLAIGRPYLSEGYLQSAIAASIADDADRSIELAEESVRFGPGSARARNFLATAYRRKWEKSQDRSWLLQSKGLHKTAIELAPSVGLYYDEYGKTLWAMGNEADAVAAWRSAHARYPIDPAFAVQLGHGLWVTGRPDEARQLLESAARSESAFLSAGSPELAPFYELHFMLAGIYDEQGEMNRALDEYQYILDLSTRSPERIADGPLLAGRLAVAPKSWYAPRSYLEMGDLYQRHGMTDHALVAYRRAVEMDANYVKAKKRIVALESPAGNTPR